MTSAAIQNVAAQDCAPATIFRRNLGAATVLWLGVVTAGVLSGASLVVVGWFLTVSTARLVAHGIAPSVLLAASAPHGVLEIAALLWAASAGLGGWNLLMAMLSKPGYGHPSAVVRSALRDLVISGFMLAAAACIECWVTPLVIRHVAQAR